MLRVPTISASAWPRFTRYEVVDGRLQPASNDLRAYDVWEGFAPGEREADSPQQHLLDLAHAYRTIPAADLESYLTDWAAHHGLLGLGISRMVYTRYRISEGRGWAASRHQGALRLWQVLRGGEEPFAYVTDEIPFPCADYGDGAFDEFAVVNPDLTNRNLIDSWCDTMSPEDYWRDYLPDFASSRPEIGSASFWRSYGEPVSEFVRTALSFERAVHTQLELPYLARDAAMEIDRRSQQVRWKAASLIGAYAAMALQEIAGGFVYRQCDCGKLFPARQYGSRPMKAYCSETCKQRVKKRRQRAQEGSDS